MKPFRRAAVVGAAFALTLIAGAGSGQAATLTVPRYRIVYLSAENNTGINSVVAPGRNSGWAIGSNASGKSFLLRWNGTRWRRNTLPGPSSFQADALGASAPDNVWLVGLDLNTGMAIGFRYNGTSWQPISIPQMGSPGTPIVLSPSDAWLVQGMSCTFTSGTLSACSTVLWHWDGQGWTSQTFNEAVVGMAGASGQTWLAALTAVRWPNGSGEPNGRLAVYDLTGSQWQPMPFSGPRVYGFFDTVAATSAHDLWITARPVKETVRQSGVFHFNGGSWKELPVPASQPAQLFPTLPDGRGGIWLGPWSHWTGRRWISAFPAAGFRGVDCFGVNAMATIPGSSHIWSAGWAHRIGATDNYNAMVALYGTSRTTAGVSPATARAVCVVHAGQPASPAIGAGGRWLITRAS